MQGLTDAQVLDLARTQPEAFAVIFDRHFDTIHRYLSRRLGRDGGDELAGEVLRIAFEQRDGFDPSWSSARPYLYGIATNLVRAERRREHSRLRLAERVAGLAPVGPDAIDDRVSESVLAASNLARVGPALDHLAAGDRDALILFAVENLSYADVATVLEIPVGTVRSRINRARALLRELLAMTEQQPVRPIKEVCDG